jgi:hypothetical protein
MATATCGEVTGHRNKTTGKLCKRDYGSCESQELIETKAALETAYHENERLSAEKVEKDQVIERMGRVIAEKDRVIVQQKGPRNRLGQGGCRWLGSKERLCIGLGRVPA